METRKIADQNVTIHKYNTVVIGAGVFSYNVPVENVLKVKQICLG